MAQFELKFANSVRKDLKKINKHDVPRILAAIDDLRIDPKPQGSQKLVDHELFRIRVGVYRIVYEVHEGELLVLVVKIGHRKNIYK